MVAATEEKNRARLAYCLTQWRRPGGGGIPQSEEGIAEHQALVADYEIIYGQANPNSLRQYAAVYSGIRMGIEAQAENDAETRAYYEQQRVRREQEEAASRERMERMLESQRREEAERTLSANGQLIPLLAQQVDRLTQYTTRDAERVVQLQGMLESERYANSPLRGEIVGNMADVQERLDEYRERLAKFQEDVAEAEAEMDWARDVLGMEEPATATAADTDTVPDTDPRALTVQFRQKKNGFYHPAGRSDRAALAAAGFRRAMGDAMVITPDGRVKAWTDIDMTEVVLNGVALDLEPSGSCLLAQTTPEEFSTLVGGQNGNMG